MSTEPASVDVVLGQLEAAIDRLADGRAPIDDLVGAYEEGLRLLAQAQARLELLAERAGLTSG